MLFMLLGRASSAPTIRQSRHLERSERTTKILNQVQNDNLFFCHAEFISASMNLGRASSAPTIRQSRHLE